MDKKLYKFKFGVTVALEAPPNSPFPIVDPDIYQSVDWLSENSFDSIELHIRTPDLIDRTKLKEYLIRKNMMVSSIGTGLAVAYEQLTLTSPDPWIRKQAIERLKKQIHLGAYMNCPVIIGSMHGNIPEGTEYKTIHNRMTEACKELMDYADPLGVDMVIEAIDRSETNFLMTADQVLELIEQVGSPHLKVHLDTFHMNIEETSWDKPVLTCKDRLGHIHVADNTRRYPGSGMIDFLPFLQAVRQVNYPGSLVLECYPWPDGYTACLLGRKYLSDCISCLSP